MPNKRKDNKGRLLRTGESQRKDLTYMYRYTDMRGKRQCVYADDLNKLREKEKKIQLDTLQGLDISGGGITVLELVERYVGLRRNVRYNTTVGYNFVLNILRKEEFGYQQVNKVRVVDAKRFLLNLYDKGRGYSSINSIKGGLKPAFQMAVNDDYLRKNPFDFKMDLIPNNSQKRVAMTEEEQERYLEYVRNDEHFSRYYDEIIVLLGTGMRISDDDDKIRLNQRKPSKYKGLSRFGPEKNLQRINKFMKERPTFYKKLIQMKENFRFYLRCFYCITKVVILQFNSEKQDRISS